MMEIEKFKRKPKEQELERISTNLEDLNAKTKELQKKIEALENQGKQADAPPPPPVEVPPVEPPMQGRNALFGQIHKGLTLKKIEIEKKSEETEKKPMTPQEIAAALGAATSSAASNAEAEKRKYLETLQSKRPQTYEEKLAQEKALSEALQAAYEAEINELRELEAISASYDGLIQAKKEEQRVLIEIHQKLEEKHRTLLNNKKSETGEPVAEINEAAPPPPPPPPPQPPEDMPNNESAQRPSHVGSTREPTPVQGGGSITDNKSTLKAGLKKLRPDSDSEEDDDTWSDEEEEITQPVKANQAVPKPDVASKAIEEAIRADIAKAAEKSPSTQTLQIESSIQKAKEKIQQLKEEAKSIVVPTETPSDSDAPSSPSDVQSSPTVSSYSSEEEVVSNVSPAMAKRPSILNAPDPSTLPPPPTATAGAKPVIDPSKLPPPPGVLTRMWNAVTGKRPLPPSPEVAPIPPPRDDKDLHAISSAEEEAPPPPPPVHEADVEEEMSTPERELPLTPLNLSDYQDAQKAWIAMAGQCREIHNRRKNNKSVSMAFEGLSPMTDYNAFLAYLQGHEVACIRPGALNQDIKQLSIRAESLAPLFQAFEDDPDVMKNLDANHPVRLLQQLRKLESTPQNDKKYQARLAKSAQFIRECVRSLQHEKDIALFENACIKQAQEAIAILELSGGQTAQIKASLALKEEGMQLKVMTKEIPAKVDYNQLSEEQRIALIKEGHEITTKTATEVQASLDTRRKNW